MKHRNFMKKYIVRCAVCMCIIGKLCAMKTEDNFFQILPRDRFEEVMAVAQEEMRKLPSERIITTHPFRVKIFVHYVLTGEVVSEEEVDNVISDKQFMTDYVRFLLVQMEAKHKSGLPVDENLTKDKCRALAIKELADEKEAIEKGFCILNPVILAQKNLEKMVTERECAWDDICFPQEVILGHAVTDIPEASMFTPFGRFLLLFDLANAARAKLPPESACSARLGNMKAIVHFVVTGDSLSEDAIDDKKFAEEYAQYLPIHLEAMRIVESVANIDHELVDSTLAVQDQGRCTT